MAFVPTAAVTAAHETGHAVVFLVCGIPVESSSIETRRISDTVTQYGFTDSREDDWATGSPLAPEAKTLRRVLGKAGGMAGELVAGVASPEEALAHGYNDLPQIGGGLISLGLRPADTSPTRPELLLAVIRGAFDLIAANRDAFDHLREELLAHPERTVRPTGIPASWTQQDDDRVLALLRRV